jgi:hypothetical protein
MAFFRKNPTSLLRSATFLFFLIGIAFSFSQTVSVTEAADSCTSAAVGGRCLSKPSSPTESQCPLGDTVDGLHTDSCGTGKVCCVSTLSDGGTPGNGGGSGTPGNGGGSGTPAPSSQTINFSNPLKFSTVEGLLDQILSTLRGIIVILSLIFIVIGAVLYITSAGNDGQMKTAKGAITAAMIGLALGLAAPSFLKEIGTVLGWGAVNSGAVGAAKTLSEIATNVLNFLLSIVGILSIIMLVIGGIMYLTAAGDEDRIDSGKKIVKYSVIGILTALAALVIVSQIATFFV